MVVKFSGGKMSEEDKDKIEVILYNFVEGEIPDSVKKLFNNGMNAVPNLQPNS